MEYAIIIELLHSAFPNERVLFPLLSLECIHTNIYTRQVYIFALLVFCLVLKLGSKQPLIVSKCLFQNPCTCTSPLWSNLA